MAELVSGALGAETQSTLSLEDVLGELVCEK